MDTNRDRHTPPQGERRRRGGVLAEFALVSFIVWLLLAGVLELGRALTAQQLLQHAARTIARETAQLELPADFTFEQAMQSAAFRSNVIDTRFLVIDSELLVRCGYAKFGDAGHDDDLDALFATLPIGNQILRPLMIPDEWGPIRMIRYPGALLLRDTPPTSAPDCQGSIFSVGIARVDSAAAAVTWHPVIDEVPSPAGVGGFALSAGGWVGLEVNYPFQSAGMVAAESTGEIDPITGRETQRLIDADQVLTDVGLDRLDGTPAPSAEDAGAYAGWRGLGRLYSLPDATGMARAVRPFRRVLTANAGFRREIFGGGAS